VPQVLSPRVGKGEKNKKPTPLSWIITFYSMGSTCVHGRSSDHQRANQRGVGEIIYYHTRLTCSTALMLSYFIYLFIPPFVLSFVPASFFCFCLFLWWRARGGTTGEEDVFFFLLSTRLFFSQVCWLGYDRAQQRLWG